jgi:hypothetical protein
VLIVVVVGVVVGVIMMMMIEVILVVVEMTIIMVVVKKNDIIDKYNVIIRPTPLVTMKQNIYNIDKKYNDNNIYINEINQKFKIIDRISHDTFKIMINDKIKILHYKEIIDKYWDCLSFCDKEYIINLHD